MPRTADDMGLPPRVFLYTLDQIAMMLGLEMQSLKNSHIFFEGRHVGTKPKMKMRARDISGEDDSKPDWRVTEFEFKRWLKLHGFRVYERTTVN